MIKTLQWVLANIKQDEGIIVSDKNPIAYPEVSGYLIPTLINYGYRKEAVQIGDWLARIQNADGSISLGNDKYLFDTAMVCLGWQSLLGDGYWMSKYDDNIERAYRFLTLQNNGEFKLQYHMQDVPQKILIWTISLLYSDGYDMRDIWDKICNDPKTFEFDCLLHFHCYVLDAVLSVCNDGRAIKAVQHLALLQRPDGSIPAYSNVDWVCYTGVAQSAILFYKCGMRRQGDLAMQYLESVMNEDGSFYGCSEGGNYFPNEKISWASKFYLDAYQLMIQSHMDAMYDQFQDTVTDNDVRLQFLLNNIKKKIIPSPNKIVEMKNILDIGCGKGKYDKHLFGYADITGIDISKNAVEYINKNLHPSMSAECGSALNIPFASQYFDIAFSVEVFEHIPSLVENAIKEVVRVLKDDGTFILIDKNKTFNGQKEKWEDWFDMTEMNILLSQYFHKVSSATLDHQFIGWVGSCPKKLLGD